MSDPAIDYPCRPNSIHTVSSEGRSGSLNNQAIKLHSISSVAFRGI